MTVETTKHIMAVEEFTKIASKLKGGRIGWIERVSELTGIDKPTLSKYASGKREITMTHALFLRQTYFLHNGFPDLASDLNFMIRHPITDSQEAPQYAKIKETEALKQEINSLKGSLKKIEETAYRARTRIY